MKNKKIIPMIYNLIIISLIALIFIFSLQMRPNAKLESEDEIIARLNKINDDNPQSNNYLITDELVQNVLPGTTVDVLKNNIAEEVNVYKNSKIVTDGLVETGMQLEYIENGRRYDISVLGDINRDGILNQIELTREIRDILETDNWKIDEEIEKISGDVNEDKKIDQKDTEVIINYIVFGKLNIKNYDLIAKPQINVLSGVKSEDRYESNVEINIVQTDINAKKTIYKIISGDKEDNDYIEIKNSEKIKIENDGVYRIIAYSYGEYGNKSKGETVLILREQPTYTVKYLPGINGEFEPQITHKLHIGDETPEYEGEIKGKIGYEFAGWNEEVQKTVTGNKEYIANWNLINYNIEYELDGGTLSKQNPEIYTVETESFTLNNPQKYGYEFLGWEDTQGKIEKEVVIPKGTTGNRKYTAKWKVVSGIKYLVETYKMNINGEYEKTVTEYRGNANETINIEPKVERGFTYEEDLSLISGNINPDGSSVFKIYYSRNKYKLIVIAENGIEELNVKQNEIINQSEKIEIDVYYEAEVEISAKTKKGYTWNSYKTNNKLLIENNKEIDQIIKMPLEDVEITATATINEYSIDYDLDGGIVKQENPNKYTVETETFILTNPTKTGYDFIGWIGSNGEEPEETVTIEKGSTGNKKYTAKWDGAEGIPYIVKTYIMNLDGVYEETIREESGKVDEEIVLDTDPEPGFTYEETLSKPIGKVRADGKTVLTVYYSRNKYIIKLIAEKRYRECKYRS